MRRGPSDPLFNSQYDESESEYIISKTYLGYSGYLHFCELLFIVQL